MGGRVRTHLRPEVDHAEANRVPELVAPVAVGHDALDVQVDVAALQRCVVCVVEGQAGIGQAGGDW